MKLSRKENITAILIVIASLIVLAIGATFAYFSIIVTGNENSKDITISTASLILKYIDGPEIILDKGFPGEFVEKEVRVENAGSVAVSYAIGLIGLSSTFVNDELVISYTCTSYKNYGEEDQHESGICYSLEETPIDASNPGLEEGITIGVGVTQVYNIRIEFKETNSNQNSNRGAEFSAAINIGEFLDSFTIVMEVVDENGDPVRGTGEIHSKVRSGVIDENGILELPMVSVGNHTLVIKDEQGEELLRKTVYVQTAPIAEINGDVLRVEKGSEEVVIRIQVNRVDAIVSMLDYPRLTTILNGGTSTQSIPQRMESGTTLDLVNPTKEGYVFNGWIVDGTSTLERRKFTMGEMTTLVATWKEETPLTSFEYTTNYEGIIKNPLGLASDDKIVVLTKYIGTSTDLAIPSSYMINNEEYKTVILSFNSVTTSGCFKGSNIETITFDKDVKAIQQDESISYNIMSRIFDGVSTLRMVYNIPDNISTLTYSFRNCVNLAKPPILPDSLTSLVGTFYGCTSLIEAPIISPRVKNITSAFSRCTNLTKAPILPPQVNSLELTFYGCTSLKEAPAIPNSVTSMFATFSNCTSLVKAPALPPNVTRIEKTFNNCTSLVEAPVIPNSVTNMKNAFSYCTSLVETPTIPNSVTNMHSTFSGCTSLVEAPTIPNSVTDMRYTFQGCTNLTGVVKINAQNITSSGSQEGTNYMYNIFSGTTKPIIVQIKNGSTTLTTFNRLKKPSNVTLETFD